MVGISPLGDKVEILSSIGDCKGGDGTLIDTGEEGGVGRRWREEGEAGGVAGAGGVWGVGGVEGRSASM